MYCWSLLLLLPPTASNSSMKMIAGSFLRAAANKSRTLLAPTPTNISSKSDLKAVSSCVPVFREGRLTLRQRKMAHRLPQPPLWPAWFYRYQEVFIDEIISQLTCRTFHFTTHPVSSTPLGNLPPSEAKAVGSFKKATISCSS